MHDPPPSSRSCPRLAVWATASAQNDETKLTVNMKRNKKRTQWGGGGEGERGEGKEKGEERGKEGKGRRGRGE